ncbi:HNH endonuclease signature motif containing protein [Aeromicrobium sp. IC_218]|uniref:HNH endonuclease signature motif containing protein n=1 Tax=Aeromicrobium sp. IC_218 TaxID=2545468 RepID=UPI0013F4B827|nr:HNH endonuclease signature motif containing protein [Aeromicrobium sp. IC_218]
MVAELVETESPVAFLDELERALDAADPSSYLGLSPDEARRAAMRIQRLQARLAAHSAAVVRAVDALVPVGLGGSTGTADLLARDFGRDRRAASRQVRLARSLGERTATERALAEGLITEAQAVVIVNALLGVPAEHQERCEQTLIAAAQTLSAKDLSCRARRIADVYAPKPVVDQIENDALEKQEARAWERTEFWMADNRDGTWRGGFVLPDLQAELLKTMLDAFTAPRQGNGRFHKLNDRSAPEAIPVPEPVEGTLGQRQGHAFAHLVEKMPVDGLPQSGTTAATLVVTMQLKDLRDGLAASTLATGTRLSGGETRRLACTAGVVPAVLDGESLPLDLGRTKRLFTKHQKTALGLRDLGCVAPGCDRPPSWSEVHHPIPWSAGGTTDLDNAVLLCPRHHHQAHRDGWQFRRDDHGRVQTRGPDGQWRDDGRWRAA